MKVLVVDDEFHNRLLLKKLLGPYGEVDLVTDGVEALQTFTMAHEEGLPYDIIFMDIMMPNMDGHEAVQAMRKMEMAELGICSPDGARIVMLTALDAPKDIMQAFYRDGCTEYIVKPLTQEKLDDILNSMDE